MRKRNLVVIAAIFLLGVGSFAPDQAKPQEGFSLSGRILATTQIARFTIKLYPPLNSGKPTIITTSTDSGQFQFTNVPASTYLLEVVSGSRLVHQELIKLDSNKTITIDLRKPAT